MLPTFDNQLSTGTTMATSKTGAPQNARNAGANDRMRLGETLRDEAVAAHKPLASDRRAEAGPVSAAMKASLDRIDPYWMQRSGTIAAGGDAGGRADDPWADVDDNAVAHLDQAAAEGMDGRQAAADPHAPAAGHDDFIASPDDQLESFESLFVRSPLPAGVAPLRRLPHEATATAIAGEGAGSGAQDDLLAGWEPARRQDMRPSEWPGSATDPKGSGRALVEQLAAIERHVARLDGIERQILGIAEHISDERFSRHAERAGLAEQELQGMAQLVASNVSETLVRHGSAVAARAPQGSETDAMLSAVLTELRSSTDQTATVLDGIQQALIAVLDRLDAMDTAQTRPAAATPSAPAAPPNPQLDPAEAPAERVPEPGSDAVENARPAADARPDFDREIEELKREFAARRKPLSGLVPPADVIAGMRDSYVPRDGGKRPASSASFADYPHAVSPLRGTQGPITNAGADEVLSEPADRPAGDAAAHSAAGPAAASPAVQPAISSMSAGGYDPAALRQRFRAASARPHETDPSSTEQTEPTEQSSEPAATPDQARGKAAARTQARGTPRLAIDRSVLLAACCILIMGLAGAVLLRPSTFAPTRQAQQILPDLGPERTGKATAADAGRPSGPASATAAPPAAPSTGTDEQPEPQAAPRRLRPVPETVIDEIANEQPAPIEPRGGLEQAAAGETELRGLFTVPFGILLNETGALPTPRELQRQRDRETFAALSAQLGAAQTRPISGLALSEVEPSAAASPMGTAGREGELTRVPVPDDQAAANDGSVRRAAGDLPPAMIGPMSLRLAAQAGDPSALCEVAVRFAEGRGIQQDFHQAVTWYQRSAAKGFALAQYRLASMYERGLGVPLDLARARVWYQRAAEQGNVKSMHNLAVLLAGGERPDYAAAAPWFEKAAEHGLADSQYNLAVLLESGLGVEQDISAAYRWLVLASRTGDKQANSRRHALKQRIGSAAAAGIEKELETWRARAGDGQANDARVGGQAWKSRQESAEG